MKAHRSTSLPTDIVSRLQDFFAQAYVGKLTFINNREKSIDYDISELRIAAIQCHYWFSQQRNIMPGDKVAIMHGFSFASIATILGAWSYGLGVVLIDSQSSREIIQKQLLDSTCKILACNYQQAKSIQNSLLDTLVREIILLNDIARLSWLNNIRNNCCSTILRESWHHYLSNYLQITTTSISDIIAHQRIKQPSLKIENLNVAIIQYIQSDTDDMGSGVVFSLSSILHYLDRLKRRRQTKEAHAICVVQPNMYGLTTLCGHILLAKTPHITIMSPKTSSSISRVMSTPVTPKPTALYADVEFYQSLLLHSPIEGLSEQINYFEGSSLLSDSELKSWNSQYNRSYYTGNTHHVTVHFYSYGIQNTIDQLSFQILDDIKYKFIPRSQSTQVLNKNTLGHLLIAGNHFSAHYWQHPGATIEMYTLDNYLRTNFYMTYALYQQITRKSF